MVVVLGWSVRLVGAHGGGGQFTTGHNEKWEMRLWGRRTRRDLGKSVEVCRASRGKQPESWTRHSLPVMLLPYKTLPYLLWPTFSTVRTLTVGQNPRLPLYTITTTSWMPPDLGWPCAMWLPFYPSPFPSCLLCWLLSLHWALTVALSATLSPWLLSH